MRSKPIIFLVRVKDLYDREKNPNISLSVEAVLKNEKIPKIFLSPPQREEAS